MIIQKKKTPKTLKIAVIALMSLTLIGGAGVAFAYTNHIWPFPASSTTSPTSDSNTPRATNSVDYSGPSTTDTAESQNAKKNASDNASDSSSTQPNGSSTSNGGKKSANVGISYAAANASNLEIRAFVNNVIEGTGKCTATVTKGSVTITKSSDAFIDTSSSICEPIYIPLSQLSAGEWSVDVKYSSPTATGSSGPEKVTIS